MHKGESVQWVRYIYGRGLHIFHFLGMEIKNLMINYTIYRKNIVLLSTAIVDWSHGDQRNQCYGWIGVCIATRREEEMN